MTPTNQTKFSAFTSKGERITYGNCLVACIASVLDVDIHEVPNLYTLYGITRPQPPDAVDTPYWAEVLNTWMRENHGKELEIMTAIAYASRVTKDANYPRTAIVKGMSHRDKPHCCIYHLSTLIWDPHPSREGLKEMKHVYVIKTLVDEPVKQPLSTQIQVALSNGIITGSEAIAISASGMSVEEFLRGKHNTITGDVKDLPEKLYFVVNGEKVEAKEVEDKSWHTPIIIKKSFAVSNGSEIECTTYKTTDAVIDPLQAIEERKRKLNILHHMDKSLSLIKDHEGFYFITLFREHLLDSAISKPFEEIEITDFTLNKEDVDLADEIRYLDGKNIKVFKTKERENNS